MIEFKSFIFDFIQKYRIYETFVPNRTGHWKDFLVDLSFPNTFHASLKDKSLAQKVGDLAGCIFLDLSTLPFRLITAFPRVLYNKIRQNETDDRVNRLAQKTIVDDESDYGSALSHQNTIIEDHKTQSDYGSALSDLNDYQSDLDQNDLVNLDSSILKEEKPNLLEKFTEEFKALREAISEKDQEFLDFFGGVLSTAFNKEDIQSFDVTKDDEVGTVIKLGLKNEIELNGTMNKQMGLFKPNLSFQVIIPKTLQICFDTQHALNFYTPITLTVFGTKALVSKVIVKLEKDKPYFEYESNVQNSLFHNSELMTLKLSRKEIVA
jgi:hypothetical protein